MTESIVNANLETGNAIKKTGKQFIKFALVGVINTLIDITILNIQMNLTGITRGFGYSIQKTISFLCALTFSYFVNKSWTFEDKSKEKEAKKMSQFFLVGTIGMLINVTTATLTVSYLQNPINNLLQLSFLTPKIWGTIGALCGTAVGLLWNFTGYKWWVFKK